MQIEQSFSAKVSYMGETKRMTQIHNFDQLVARTRNSFTNLPSTGLKFFYTDSENDLISVSGPQDLDEAPLFYFSADGKKSATVIKLIVAENSQQAFDQIANNGILTTEEESAFTIIDTRETMQTEDLAAAIN